MSFRNFDNRDRYYDLLGRPLLGCVQFMLKDGNTVAPIFDGDMVPLANPQLTDILGRTVNQVFIDSEVIAYMYKYIGRGTLAEEEALGIDTSDESKWALQYTVESAAIDTRHITGESAMGVPNIDALRDLDVTEVPEIYGNKIITLHGYYTAGDCEPVTYIWDSESTLNDDNGSVIAPEGVLTGRWILVQPTEHCDSRHFGIFPQDSADSEVDHSTRITQFLAYCNTRSIHPYFNGSVSYPYFIYTSVAYNSRNPIDVSDDVQFVDKGSGNRFFGQWNGNPYFVNANTTLNSKFVRHSWHFKNYAYGTVKYIVDDRWSPVILSNIEVEIELPPASGSQFDDCEITSNEMFTENVVLQNLVIHTDWFDDNYDWANLQLYGCTILLQNCKDANTYVLLKNKQNEANYGDLGEQTLTNASLLANAIAENAVFNNVTLNGSVELHNVSGSVNVTGSQYDMNIIDCWLNIGGENIVFGNVQWRRGAIISTAQIRCLTKCDMWDVDVNAQLIAYEVDATFKRCVINSAVIVKGGTFKDCDINAVVTTSDIDGKVSFMFDGCRFGANGQNYVTSDQIGAQVTGAWLNNFASDAHPIVLNMDKLYSTDISHVYRYEGNSGAFLQRYPRLSFTQQTFYYIDKVVADLATNSSPILITPHKVLQPTGNLWMEGIFIPTRWVIPCKFFGIGECLSDWTLSITYEYAQNTGMNDSAWEQNTQVTATATCRAYVADPANYLFAEFGGKTIGGLTLAPNNFTAPKEIRSLDPSEWPTGTNSAHIVIERVR